MGACRYCGQGIPDQSATLPNTPPAFAAGGPGNTTPTLPQLDQPPAGTVWNEAANNNAPTQFGPLSFAPPDGPTQGTAAFGVTPPAANMPQPGGPPSPGVYAPVSALPAQPPAAPARKSGRKMLALVIVAAVVLVAAIGGGLLVARGFNKPSASHGAPASASSPTLTSPATPRPSATPTATPTATPVPTSAYRDPNGLFSLRYPADWSHEDTSSSGGGLPLPLNGVRFHSGDAELEILTGQEVPGLPTDGLAEQVNTLLLNSMNAQNVSSARPREIGGKTWTENEADTDGGKHMVIASISFNGHLYTLWYSAPASAFSADEQQFFTPMIASFSFGG